MMNPIPGNMLRFILDNHVVGVATVLDGAPWAASCFYAFDEASGSLIILSDKQTRHGVAMLANPCVAGTIASQPAAIPQIKGIQLVAQAQHLQNADEAAAYSLYCKRHPIARLKRSHVWQLRLDGLKYTDNSRLIGQKIRWQRGS